jgi:hypothetical protein
MENSTQQVQLTPIQKVLENNKLEDLQEFLKRRHCLNRCNTSLVYLFHIIQSLGILASSYSASTNDTRFLWAGIGLNMFASVIQIYEKINNDQMKKIYMDIQSIQKGTYLDESPFVELDGLKQSTNSSPQQTNQAQELNI